MSDITSASLRALGICLEEYDYPYPVYFLPLSNDLQPITAAGRSASSSRPPAATAP